MKEENEEQTVLINQSNTLPVGAEMLEQFKSIFYLLKGKRDTQIKLYDENKTFYKHNIIDLNTLIQEKLLLHHLTNLVVNVNVGLSKGKIKTFGNWNEFVKEKWETNDETESIVITWDFEVTLPNRIHNLPQTHTLKVRIGSEIKPSEFLHLMMTGSDEFELEESSSQMVCKVDFVNSIIASELLERVSEWYQSLSSKLPQNSTNVLLNKWSRKIRMLTEVLIIIAGICLFLPIAEYVLIKSKAILVPTDYLRYNFYLLIGVFITFTIFTRIGNYYAQKLDRTIDKLNGTPIFEITKGDKNLLDKILNKNKSLRREIYLKIFVSIIASGILYIMGKGIMLIINNI